MSKWISVKKRLPKIPKGEQDTDVLFNVPDEENSVCAGTFFKRGNWKSLQGQPYSKKKVSHWMPIPDAPKAREQ